MKRLISFGLVLSICFSLLIPYVDVNASEIDIESRYELINDANTMDNLEGIDDIFTEDDAWYDKSIENEDIYLGEELNEDLFDTDEIEFFEEDCDINCISNELEEIQFDGRCSGGGDFFYVMANVFTPRMSAPEKSNTYYYSNNPFYQSGYGMPNCTCYAFGRVWEITGNKPRLSLGNASGWWDYNKNNGYYTYGQSPKLGAVACWSSGHVAVVEKIENNTITLSESAWSGRQAGSEWANFFVTEYSDPHGKRYVKYPSGHGYVLNSGFQGYIYACGDINTDTISPSITDIRVENVNSRGYDVSCIASDNVGVTRVAFPTWTDFNGQDDLKWHEGSLVNGRWTCHISTADHNNEKGVYYTHIYVYDAAGNNVFGATFAEVHDPVVAVTGVTLDTTSVTLRPNESKKLKATITPSNATNMSVTWKSSNTSVATVSSGGVITAKSAGAADIIAVTVDGNKTATCKVTVLQEYTVSFDSQGGTSVSSIGHLLAGEKITAPADPTRFGYEFAGWYKENSCINKWNFAADTVAKSITLYAKWIENEYSFCFDVNGGVSAPANKNNILYSEKIGDISDAKPLKGMVFVCWNTKADGKGVEVTKALSPKDILALGEGNYTISDNFITIYAIYMEPVPLADEVKVTFNPNGGSRVPVQIVKKGKKAEEPEQPEKNDLVFGGWYVDENLEIPFDFSSPLWTDITLYAKWLNVYTVRFMERAYYLDPETNYQLDAVQVIQGDNVDEPESPSLKGYVFEGWYTDPEYNTLFDFSTKINQNLSLYGKLRPIQFIVRFDANGGSGMMRDQVLSYDSSSVLSSNNFVKDGFFFLKWAVEKVPDNAENGSWNTITTFEENSDSISTYCDEDGGVVTLYAIWRPEPDYILLQYNDDTNILHDNWILAYVGQKLNQNNEELFTPHLEGMYFDGWYTEKTGGIKIDPSEKYDGSYSKLYAHWSSIEYKVTFHSNLERDTKVTKTYRITNASTQKISFDSIFANLNISDDKRALFCDWTSGSNDLFSENELTAKNIIKKEYVRSGDSDKTVAIDIYANWNPSYSYKAIFVAGDNASQLGDGGKYEVEFIPEYGYGHIEKLAADEIIYLTGDEFVNNSRNLIGWNYSVNGGVEKTIGVNASLSNLGVKEGDVVIFRARWSSTENEYKLNLVTNGGKVKTGELRNRYKYNDNPAYYLPQMEKTGYVFKGWYLNNYTSVLENDTYNRFRFVTVGKEANVIGAPNRGRSGDLTLYAVFEKTKYSVSFNKNGGQITNIDDSLYSLSYDESLELKGVSYSKPGYKFKNWKYIDDNGLTKTIAASGSIKNLSAIGRNNIVLEAIWEPLSYTIKYSLGSGGSINKTAIKSYKPGNDISLSKPSRVGYEFRRWKVTMKDKKAGSITASLSSDGLFLKGESYGNIILTAEWKEKNNYRFRFMSSDGTDLSDFSSVTAPGYGSVYDFTDIACDISKSVYAGNSPKISVKGFALKAKNKNPKYKLNRTYKMSEIIKNAGSAMDGNIITLYVITEPQKLFYSFENGATGEKKTVSYSISSGATVKAPAVKGYDFVNWEVTGGNINTDYSINKNILKIKKGCKIDSFNIKAVYQVNTYKILLLPNASVVFEKGLNRQVSSQGIYYKNSADVSYDSMRDLYDSNVEWVREGYTFSGFALKKNAKPQNTLSKEGGLIAKNRVVKLYAVWKANEYSISVGAPKVEGHTTDYAIKYNTPKIAGKVTFGKTISLPSKVSSEGFRFKGWLCDGATDVKTNKSGYVTKIGPKNTGNITLIPVFSENSYSVQINPNGGVINGSKNVLVLGQYWYSQNVLSDLNRAMGGDVFSDITQIEATRNGYRAKGIALSANGKSSIYNPKYIIRNTADKVSGLARLSSINKSKVTIYIIWEKVSTPEKVVIRPTLNNGVLKSNISDHYLYQAQYSSDPTFINVSTLSE
ncbi:InlB B-repeat-containing protein [Butyrivibrio sp. MC2013]|uniref:InlB B-repeat-containing protein n=1 Tax=Butyrivibrio sp. MC2013 TaxID=1280686 RepID=UPI0003FF2141|nr:InlB B-repeat-containing protein [Butyrivibrio sp. MC2013]